MLLPDQLGEPLRAVLAVQRLVGHGPTVASVNSRKRGSVRQSPKFRAPPALEGRHAATSRAHDVPASPLGAGRLDRPPVATFMLASSVGGAFKTEFKLPGTESQAAFDLLEKSSFRNRQVQAQIVFGPQDGIDAAGQAGDGAALRRGRAEDPRRRRREPLRRGRRAAGRRATGRSRTRRSTSPTGRARRSPSRARRSSSFADEDQRARAHASSSAATCSPPGVRRRRARPSASPRR